MVKLLSIRGFRQYGTDRTERRGEAQKSAELANAGLYLAGVGLMLIGSFFLLPWMNRSVAFILLSLGVLVVAIVNLWDLFAHLAGMNFRIPPMTQDPQLGLVEIASPLVNVIGSLLAFAGFIILYLVERGSYRREHELDAVEHAVNLLIAGPALLLLGSVHNNCQIYHRESFLIQFFQHSAGIPFIIGSTIWLVTSILTKVRWDDLSLWTHYKVVAWLSVATFLFWTVGGAMNIVRILQLQQEEAGHPGFREQIEQVTHTIAGPSDRGRGAPSYQEALLQKKKDEEKRAVVPVRSPAGP